MSATRRLALIALAMSGFLAFLVVQHASARAKGTEIVLDVRGYDPRDVFLGRAAPDEPDEAAAAAAGDGGGEGEGEGAGVLVDNFDGLYAAADIAQGAVVLTEAEMPSPPGKGEAEAERSGMGHGKGRKGSGWGSGSG